MRLLKMLAATGVVLGLLASTAAAADVVPYQASGTASFTVPFCSFPVQYTLEYQVNGTITYDDSGQIATWRMAYRATYTYSANGKTITGTSRALDLVQFGPGFTLEESKDAGLLGRFVLPDGNVASMRAGVIVIESPGVPTLDAGVRNSGSIEGFCAALAPDQAD